MVSRVIGLAALSLTLSACTQSIADLSCDDVEDQAVDMAGGSLIKITGARVVTRTDHELVCNGTGIYTDDTEVATRYRAYLDEDGDLMYSVDTDEADADAQAAEEASARKEAQRELDQGVAEARRVMAEIHSAASR